MKLFSFWRSLATFRVRIAMNLKGLTPAEVVEINLVKGQQREEAFRKVNPMMAIPALVEDDGTVLYESLAIIEYLDEVHPNPPLLPRDPRGRARVRALAQIVAADSHPLCVPRVRDYLEHVYKLDEATRTEWCAHWIRQALDAIEKHLSAESETGRCCHGDTVTLADICLATQVAGAGFYKVDLEPYPTVRRIAGELFKIDAFARAHPLKQPGAPASV